MLTCEFRENFTILLAECAGCKGGFITLHVFDLELVNSVFQLCRIENRNVLGAVSYFAVGSVVGFILYYSVGYHLIAVVSIVADGSVCEGDGCAIGDFFYKLPFTAPVVLSVNLITPCSGNLRPGKRICISFCSKLKSGGYSLCDGVGCICKLGCVGCAILCVNYTLYLVVERTEGNERFIIIIRVFCCRYLYVLAVSQSVNNILVATGIRP